MGFNTTGLYDDIEAMLLSQPESAEAAALALKNAITDNFTEVAPTETEWTNLTLANGWAWYGAGYQVPQYKKIGDRVYFRGCIKGTSATSYNIVDVMPAGYRPEGFIAFPAYAGVTTVRALVVSAAGLVYTDAYHSIFYLDCVSYDAVPLVGWADIPLNGAWVWQGGAYATPQYKKVGNRVYLKGNIKNGTTTKLFTLPAGYRPAALQGWSSCVSNAAAHVVTIGADGIGYMSTLRTWVYLDTISFEVAP